MKSGLLTIIIIVLFCVACQKKAPMLRLSPKGLGVDLLYERMNLEGKLDHYIFRYAMQGYQKINPENEKLIIVDFTKPSVEKRFLVLDLEASELSHYTYVAHGENSGFEMARSFSNIPGSKQSSLGFYTTAETYFGKHGLSVKLDGLEKDFNDAARDRWVVIHTADYVGTDYLEENQVMGQSWGCPAIPEPLGYDIIEQVKNGACLFIYADDKEYLGKSEFL
ncbi:MAG: murein L,D-transpeptidase catalytic domain family protein [Flavobacteriales bacterium]|nr:murein L,D-transpeptidase catalytic domain family protein [Flavobacteriales bacterium]